MKKLLIFIIFFNCCKASNKPIENCNQLYSVYENDIFSVNLPKDWAIAESIDFTSLEDTISNGFRAFSVSLNETSFSLDSNFILSVPEIEKEVNIIDTGSYVFSNGVYSKFIELKRFDPDLGDVYGKVFFFTENNIVVTLNAMTTFSTDDRLDRFCVIDKMIKTFNLKKVELLLGN